MPTRHPSHQLEERSRRRFADLLPEAWVVRDKHPDYGVDLEVEIFSDQGGATGLTFNVQLRATADPAKARKLRMDVEQMAYFSSLPSPTLLVRYCRPMETFHWRWHDDQTTSVPQEGAKSLTISFSEANIWASQTSALIAETLELRRSLATLKPGGRICLVRPPRCDDLHLRFAVESAIDRLLQRLRWLVEAMPGEMPLVRIAGPDDSGAISAELGSLGKASIAMPSTIPATLYSQLVYALTRLLKTAGLTSHAADLAKLALEDRMREPDRDTAALACMALVKEPISMAELAILNDLPAIQDPAYLTLQIALVSALAAGPDAPKAASMIFDAAMASAHFEQDIHRQATILYSRGNFLSRNGDPRGAFHCFRAAQKLWPRYAEKSYFRIETADALFSMGRVRLALRLYQMEPDQADLRVNRRVANALMSCGHVEEAARRYRALTALDQPPPTALEMELKACVCEWLAARHGEIAPRRSSEAARITGGSPNEIFDPAVYEEVISRIDALDLLSNFNVAVYRAQAREYHDAWAGFLICGLTRPQDVAAWVAALQCAMNIQEIPLVIATFVVAMQAGGPMVYEQFRAAYLDQGFPIEAVAAIDEMARDMRPGKPEEDWTLTLRMHNDFDLSPNA